MYSKTRTKLGIIYESCKLSEHLVASLAKVEQSLAIRHIAEYVYRLATAIRYCRARAETVGVSMFILRCTNDKNTSIVKSFENHRLSQRKFIYGSRNCI